MIVSVNVTLLHFLERDNFKISVLCEKKKKINKVSRITSSNIIISFLIVTLRILKYNESIISAITFFLFTSNSFQYYNIYNI